MGATCPLTSMRKELERAGAITTLPDGTLRAQRRYFMPKRFDPQWILNAGSMLRDLGSSITHNLDAGSAQDPVDGLAHLRGDSSAGRPATAWMLAPCLSSRLSSRQHGQEFLERVDKWLTEHEAKPAAGGARKRARLGLGVFLITGE